MHINADLLLNQTEDSLSLKSLETTLYLAYLMNNVLCYIPLVLFFLGLIGFIGNTITYLQPELRQNTCCVYTYCGSIIDIIHLSIFAFPDFLIIRYQVPVAWNTSAHTCRLFFFLVLFLPTLSIYFVVMSMIDRYACTCSLTSKMHRLNQLKILPWTISLTILISFLSSIYVIPMTYLTWASTCGFLDFQVYTIGNLVINGCLPPLIMLIFVLLTYHNIRSSRQRVSTVGASPPARFRNQFMALILGQVLGTAFISIQWMVLVIYILIYSSVDRSIERRVMINFVLTISSNIYYLNNVKSFYISLATSKLFRQKLFKGISKAFPHYWTLCGHEFVGLQRR